MPPVAENRISNLRSEWVAVRTELRSVGCLGRLCIARMENWMESNCDVPTSCCW